MHEPEIKELWQSLVEIQQYIQHGFLEQINNKPSFDASEAQPYFEANRKFQNAKPSLSKKQVVVIQTALDVAVTDFNKIMDVMRSVLPPPPPGDSPERIEAERRINEALKKAYDSYQKELTKVEDAFRDKNIVQNINIPRDITHQQAATPLHYLIVSILGILALVSIGGGIYAISLNSQADTKLKLFGSELSTGSVGVGLVGIGLIIIFFTIRAVLKNQHDLARIPPDKKH